MQLSSIPLRFSKVFAVNAAGAFIRTVPVPSQIGIEDGAASFDTGFVPDNFAPPSAGGVPPFGQDFNGLLNVMTAWQQWGQAGGPVAYDGTFATDVGGYPKNAIINSAILSGAQWYSTVDNNTTNPDDPLTSSGWLRLGIPAGLPVPFLGGVATGFIAASGAITIGSLASGAAYAAADALFLFAYNWANSQLPIYTSGGVVTTRGANAVADFNANKRLGMPEGRGAGVIGIDSGGSTFLNGVPVIAGNTSTPGSLLGENFHALTSAENGPHIHGITDPGHTHVTDAVRTPAGSGFASGVGHVDAPATNNSATTGITVNSSGSGTGHNNVERSLAVNWAQKL